MRLKEGGRPRAIGKTEGIVFTAYAAVVAFMTWPAVTLVSRTYAQKGDPYGVIWWLWWFRFSFARHIPSNPMSWVGVPYGRTMNPLARDPLTTATLRGLSIATTETVAYNVFLLLAFFLAAVAMYYTVRRLTASRPAAAVAGFIFAFSPYMLMQGKEHISLLPAGFIPLVFYLLVRAWKEKSVIMAALCALSFAVMTLFSFHYGLIGGALVVTFCVSVWIMGRPWKADGRRGAIARAAPAVLLMAGVAGLLIYAYANRGNAGGDMTGSYLYSARWWDYLIPHAQGLTLGWLTDGFITSHLHGGFVVENSLFLGYLPIGFAIYALYGLWRDGKKARGAKNNVECAGHDDTRASAVSVASVPGDRRIPLAFAVCAAVCFLCSFPPTVTVFGLKIYFPSYLLHYVVPDVRAYARFGVGVLFSVAMLASYGIARLLRRKEWSRHARLAVVVMSLVVLLEFSIVPPFRSVDTAATTDYYRWLKSRPADAVVAIYPFFYADDFGNYEYYFEQRHHEKKMVNGSGPGTEAERVRRTVLDVADPATPPILKRLGVDYVLVIPSLYEDGNHVNYIEPAEFDASKVPGTLRKLKEFEDCVVYENVADPAKMYPLFLAGDSQPVVYPDGTAWHPGGEEMVIDIVSELDKPVVVDLALEASAPEKEGTIEFSIDGVVTGRRKLTVWPSEYLIESVTLNPGSNPLTVRSESRASPVTEIPGATEVEAVVMVGPVRVLTTP